MAAMVAPSLRRPTCRVALTCDFLRFESEQQRWTSAQLGNLAWLEQILTASEAWRRPGLTVSKIVPPLDMEAFRTALGNHDVLADYIQDPDQAWCERYDAVAADVFPGLFAQLLESDLVIGFELPPTLKRQLHLHGRPYLNLYIHPLRFLRDLCFGATTNCPEISSALSKVTIADDEVNLQVRRFRGMLLRRQFATYAMPPGVPVLVGQTAHDSALIENGRFFDWPEADVKLNELLSGHEDVVFIEHPFRQSSRTVVDYLRCEHRKNVIVTNANGYGVLLSNPDIPTVLTLSSSLGVEAEAMDLSVQFLLAHPQDKFRVPDIDVSERGCYGHQLLGNDFWVQVLDPLSTRHSNDSREPIQAFQCGENYLRNSLLAFSYGVLAAGGMQTTACKTVMPPAPLSSQRRQTLVSSLAGEDTARNENEALALGRTKGVIVAVGDPPLRPGEQRQVALSSPAGAAHFDEGFHPPERWGAWTSAKHSRISFTLDPDVLKLSAWTTVVMEVQVFDGLLPQAPVLRIRCGKRVVGYLVGRSGQKPWHALSFSVLCHDITCSIELDMSDLTSPFAAGHSDDARSLGLAVRRLDLNCMVDALGAAVAPAGQLAPVVWGLSDEPSPILQDYKETHSSQYGFDWVNELKKIIPA